MPEEKVRMPLCFPPETSRAQCSRVQRSTRLMSWRRTIVQSPMFWQRLFRRARLAWLDPHCPPGSSRSAVLVNTTS